MGSGNSSTNSVSSILNIVSTIVTQSMQQAVNVVSLSQYLEADCLAFKLAVDDNIRKCQEDLLELGGTTPADILQVCNLNLQNVLTCGGSQIAFRQAVNLNLTADQRSAVQTAVQENLENQLTSQTLASSGLLSFNQKIKDEIAELATAVSEVFNANIQQIYSNTEGRQTVYLNAGLLQFVSLDQNVKNIVNLLMTDRDVVRLSQSIVNDISVQLAAQTSTVSTILWVAIAIIGAVVVVVIVLASIGIIGSSLPEAILPPPPTTGVNGLSGFFLV